MNSSHFNPVISSPSTAKRELALMKQKQQERIWGLLDAFEKENGQLKAKAANPKRQATVSPSKSNAIKSCLEKEGSSNRSRRVSSLKPLVPTFYHGNGQAKSLPALRRTVSSEIEPVRERGLVQSLRNLVKTNKSRSHDSVDSTTKSLKFNRKFIIRTEDKKE